MSRSSVSASCAVTRTAPARPRGVTLVPTPWPSARRASGGAERRRGAEQHDRRDREHHREHEDRRIGRNVEHDGARARAWSRARPQAARRACCKDGQEAAAAGPRQHQTECRAGQGQQDAFGQELPRHAAAARAEGEARGNFTPPRRCPGHEEDGDIRARDQQHEADQGHQDEQRRPEQLTQAAPPRAAGHDVQPGGQESVARRPRVRHRDSRPLAATRRRGGPALQPSIRPRADAPSRSGCSRRQRASWPARAASADRLPRGSVRSATCPTVVPVNPGAVTPTIVTGAP